MSEVILTALIGLIGVVLGATITSFVTWRQEVGTHKRWLIEKRIDYLKNQISDIDRIKTTFLLDIQKLMRGEKIGEGMPVDSVPMEVIEVFHKYLPNGKTSLDSISLEVQRKIWIEAASALELKKQELEKNIKKLLS